MSGERIGGKVQHTGFNLFVGPRNLPHYEKTMEHLDLLPVKRKPQPFANALPVDVSPLYVSPPGASADDLLEAPQCPVGGDPVDIMPVIGHTFQGGVTKFGSLCGSRTRCILEYTLQQHATRKCPFVNSEKGFRINLVVGCGDEPIWLPGSILQVS